MESDASSDERNSDYLKKYENLIIKLTLENAALEKQKQDLSERRTNLKKDLIPSLIFQ